MRLKIVKKQSLVETGIFIICNLIFSKVFTRNICYIFFYNAFLLELLKICILKKAKTFSAARVLNVRHNRHFSTNLKRKIDILTMSNIVTSHAVEFKYNHAIIATNDISNCF